VGSKKINVKDDAPILFFDGVCNLCNWSVDMILRLEKNDQIRFTSLQSSFSEQFLNDSNFPSSLDSIIFRDNNKNFVESDAVIEISKYLKTPFSFLKYLYWLPKGFRNIVYRMIAKNRYAIFGKRLSCRLPDGDLRSRFIS
jgi:predicted DCC family thiol-disulfide oxidoreductase YuxK